MVMGDVFWQMDTYVCAYLLSGSNGPELAPTDMAHAFLLDTLKIATNDSIAVIIEIFVGPAANVDCCLVFFGMITLWSRLPCPLFDEEDEECNFDLTEPILESSWCFKSRVRVRKCIS